MDAQAAIRESFLKAKSSASISSLGCGDEFRGLRWYPFSVTVAPENGGGIEQKVYIVNSARQLFEAIPNERGGWTATDGGAQTLHVASLSIPFFRGWSLEGIQHFLQSNSDENPNWTELFNEAKSLISMEVDAPEGVLKLFALFSVYSYWFHLFNAAPYLSVQGPAGSGKTQACGAILKLAFNGCDEHGRLALYGGRSSPAGLLRSLAENRGVVCLDDDIDALLSDKPSHSELRRALLTSYKRDGHQILVERGKPKSFNLFGPKLFSSINPLEPVLASRSIVIKMQRSAVVKRPMAAERAHAFRQKMMTYAMTFRPEVKSEGVNRKDEILSGLRYFANLCGVSEIYWGEDEGEPVGKVIADELAAIRGEGRALVSAVELQLRLRRAKGVNLSVQNIGQIIAEHRLAERVGREEIAKVKSTVFRLGRKGEEGVRGFCAQARRRVWKPERCAACPYANVGCDIRAKREAD